MRERFLSLIIGVVCLGSIACNQLPIAEEKPLVASDLAREFRKSKAEVNAKYHGKEITVRGYTYDPGKLSPALEGGLANVGLIGLGEKDAVNVNDELLCEFSKADLAEFEKVKGRQYVTVKGRFAGQGVGITDKPYLRPCKLVKAE